MRYLLFAIPLAMFFLFIVDLCIWLHAMYRIFRIRRYFARSKASAKTGSLVEKAFGGVIVKPLDVFKFVVSGEDQPLPDELAKLASQVRLAMRIAYVAMACTLVAMGVAVAILYLRP